MREIYLDNSATTRVFPEVADLIHHIYLEDYGNPSSMHHKGVEAEKYLTQAKHTLADILKVSPKNLYFTSCGSESDNLAIIGCARANARQGKHIITTNIEHPGVTEAMRYLESEGFEVTYLPVDGQGFIWPQQVAEAVRDDTILVSIMHVNNEIGTVEPVEEIGEAIKKKNPKCLFHVDAVQSFTKIPILPKKMHIDLLAVSGHKIHAPKGVAMLYVADGVKIRNIIFGGGQQNGLRSGTENVAGIAGMALAAKMLCDDFENENDKVRKMRDTFAKKVLQIPDVRINGPLGEHISKTTPESDTLAAPHIVSVSVTGVRSEVLLHALEEKGVYVSAGSACSTHHRDVKGTIDAIGVPKEYRDGTLRVSFSVMNSMEDAEDAAAAFGELVPFLRRFVRR